MNWLFELLGFSVNRKKDAVYRLVDLYRGKRKKDRLDDEYAEDEAQGLKMLMEDEGLDIWNDKHVELYRRLAKLDAKDSFDQDFYDHKNN
jgi:hypothetical protein